MTEHLSMIWRRLVPFAFLLAILAGVLTPGQTSAHATLDRSDPPANSILAESPTEIRLWFTEPLEQSESSVRLFDQTGNELPNMISEPGDGPKSMVLPLSEPLDTGTYSVVWKNISTADGHPLQGYFTFTIGTSQDVVQIVTPITSDIGGAPLWLQTVARWLVLLGMAVAIAIWPLWLLVLWPIVRNAPDSVRSYSRRASRLGFGAIVFAGLANVLMLGVQASFLEDGSLVARMGTTLTDTRFGRLWLARIGLLLLLAIALAIVSWLEPLKHRITTAAGVLATVLVPLPVSMNAHAAALDFGRATAIGFDYVHLLSASLWFGGLIVLLGVFIRSPHEAVERRTVLAQIIPRFSALALVCWGLLAVTGGYAAWLHVGSLEAFRDTPYGQTLHNKLRIIGFVFLIATANLFLISRKLSKPDTRANPRWARWLTYAIVTEVILATLIMVAVGRMTSQQPGRDLLAAERAGQTISFDLDGRDTTLLLNPGSVGVNHFTLTIPGDPTPDGTEALLRLTLVDNPIGTKEMTLDRTSPITFEGHGSELGIAGAWDIELLVRKIGEFEWTDTQSVAMEIANPASQKPHWRFDIGGIIGLSLIVIALVGFVIAWRVGKGRIRLEIAGLGMVALLFGSMLMVQGRVEPVVGYDPNLVNPIPATADVITRAADAWQANCLSCHGVDGQGDGPLAEGMFPKPADFSAAHTRMHPDAEFFYWIQNGKQGTDMPAFGDTLTDEEIWQLVDYIQVVFQDKPLVEATPVPSTPVP